MVRLFLYGTVTGLVFNKLFFPASNPFVSLMLAYTTYAVGFASRPVGGILFGHFGDRIGRKPLLVFTLLLMGIATFLIGLLPTSTRSESRRLSRYSYCGSSRASRSAVNGAALS